MGSQLPTSGALQLPAQDRCGAYLHTAWHQVAGVAAAGAERARLHRRRAPAAARRVRVEPTLARGRSRFRSGARPRRALALHDRIVARALPKLADGVDVVHTWPLGALETLEAARRWASRRCSSGRTRTHGSPTRSSHAECERLGVTLPPDHEHAYNADILRREEEEYELAD